MAGQFIGEKPGQAGLLNKIDASAPDWTWIRGVREREVGTLTSVSVRDPRDILCINGETSGQFGLRPWAVERPSFIPEKIRFPKDLEYFSLHSMEKRW